MRELHERLRAHGQEHLARHLAGLDSTAARTLAARLVAIDWAEIGAPERQGNGGEVGRAEVIPRQAREALAPVCHAAGVKAYGEGRVAVLVVAGGQGTRLGFGGPKGCYPIDPDHPSGPRTIFHLLAERIADAGRRTRRAMPWLVMTSPHTDAQTRAFFAEHSDLGVVPGQVRFLSQGTIPSLDLEGRALLAARDALLENPDGHGGCFEALVSCGELERLRVEGIDWLIYLQVDNVLGRPYDPFAVGLAETRGADALTKVVAKAYPDERVGHLVSRGGRDRVVEYTELSAEELRRRGPDGELLYRWGNTAMHCWRVGFLAELAGRGYRLPLHRSRKSLRAWRDGTMVQVQGFKSERFIFDLLPAASLSLGLEVDRAREFAPVKNADGADSPATARAMLGLSAG